MSEDVQTTEAAAPADTPQASETPETEDVLEALRDVVDPELGVNVVDLGLVYGVTLGGDGVAIIDMTLTSAACPLTDVIEDQAASALEGLVADISYDALGCSISQASASVLADLVISKPVNEAMKVNDEFLALMQSQGEGEPDEDVLGDAVAFAGVSKYPARIKCALLSWMAWKDATAQAVQAREAA